MIVAELGSRYSFIRGNLLRQGRLLRKKNTCDVQDARLEAEIPIFVANRRDRRLYAQPRPFGGRVAAFIVVEKIKDRLDWLSSQSVFNNKLLQPG